MVGTHATRMNGILNSTSKQSIRIATSQCQLAATDSLVYQVVVITASALKSGNQTLSKFN